jgi:MFS family permease
LQPSFGKIYTYFDVKWTFVAALAIFEIGSIVCATARDSPMLIVGRAIAGAGGAGLFSGGMTIIGYAIPLKHRAIYLAALSSMFGVSSIVGPILGGAFTDRLTWRWCFWINLPFGGIAILTVALFFKSPTRDFSHINFKQKVKEMDLPGAFFLISAITCLLLALSWGGVTYPWKNSKVWGCILGFGLLIIVFIVIQLRQGDHATIPGKILKQRTILASALTLAFLSMGIFT